MTPTLKTHGEEYHAKRDNRDRENEIELGHHTSSTNSGTPRAQIGLRRCGARARDPQNKRVGPRENHKPERLLMRESPHPYFG